MVETHSKSFRNVSSTFTRGHNRNLPTRMSKTGHILDNVSKDKFFVMAFLCDLFNYINACRAAPEKVRLTAKYYLPFLPACDSDCDCNCDTVIMTMNVTVTVTFSSPVCQTCGVLRKG